MPKETIPDLAAYLAMFAFLEEQYGRGSNDSLGTLLGSMALMEDGSPADAALAEDWSKAVAAVKAGKVNAKFSIAR